MLIIQAVECKHVATPTCPSLIRLLSREVARKRTHSKLATSTNKTVMSATYKKDKLKFAFSPNHLT